MCVVKRGHVCGGEEDEFIKKASEMLVGGKDGEMDQIRVDQ